MEMQGTQDTQNNLEKEGQSQKTYFVISKLQSYSNQDSVVLDKDRHIDSWNRIESIEINSYIYGQLIWTRMSRQFKRGKNSLFFFNFWILFYLFFYTAGPCQSSILYTSVYTCKSQSPNSSHHPHPPAAFPPWCPYVCSLHLCLNIILENQFICTIFLGSTYVR